MAFSKERLRDQLHEAGLSATHQRLALGELIFGQGNRHLNAEQLRREAVAASIPVSLATIYNTLRQFSRAGMLREVLVDPNRAYFDTNLGEHYHFFHEEEDRLEDIPANGLAVTQVPKPPEGTSIRSVDIIIRVRRGRDAQGKI